jgi:polar amino acid transport system substrate-binding protein
MTLSLSKYSLLSILAFSLSSCGFFGSNTTSVDACSGITPTSEEVALPNRQVLAHRNFNDKAAIQSNLTSLKVGMDLRYPPFETVATNNNPEGISVDIAMGFGNYLDVPTTIVNTNFGTLIPSLQSGEIDIVIASMSITASRQEVVDFTDPYFYFKIITLVNREFCIANNLSADTTKEELLDISGTRYAGIAAQVSASIPSSYGKTVTEYVDLPSAIEAISQGDADVLLMSASPVVSGFKANRETTMIIWDPWIASPIGMAVNKGNASLLADANAFIDTFNDENGMYNQLRSNWDAVILTQLERYGIDFYITAE